MNYYTNIKPSLINNIPKIKSNVVCELVPPTNISPPIKDWVTEGVKYIYNNFVKGNLLMIIIILVLIGILYYRNKQKRTQQGIKDTLEDMIGFNPLTRKTNTKVNYLPESEYVNNVMNINRNIPSPDPYPSMNITQYDEDSALRGRRPITGGNNPYQYFPESEYNYNDNIGYPNNTMGTTSSYGDYYTNKTKETVLDYTNLIDKENKDLIDILKKGPNMDNLMSLTFVPPYAE